MRLSKEREQELVEALLSGEKRAARAFYDAYYARLKAFVISRTKEFEDAEEICQDVFMAALDSLGVYSGRSRLFTWMCGIARHEIADYYRKKRLKQVLLSAAPVLEQMLADSEDVESAFALVELREAIEEVLDRLLPRYAAVLRMKYVRKLSVKRMARELDESFKATETALFRARKAFVAEWQVVYGGLGVRG